MSSWLIVVIEITWKVSEKRKMSINWRQQLTMQRCGVSKIGIVVQNIDASNKSAVATNAKKSENVLHM